jgi:hypothetical protein
MLALILLRDAHGLPIVDVRRELPAPSNRIELGALRLQPRARPLDALAKVSEAHLRLHQRVAHLCKSRAPLR